MSIGATTAQEDPKFSVTAQVTYTAKKVLSAFFITPTKYVFFGQLIATITGLFLGREFSWQYWLILLVLAGCNIFLFHVESNYKEVTEK